MVYLFDPKTMSLSIDWKTRCLPASSDNGCKPALIAINNPNSNGGIFHGCETSADAILWSFTHKCT
jgi:hypothetical protein